MRRVLLPHYLAVGLSALVGSVGSVAYQTTGVFDRLCPLLERGGFESLIPFRTPSDLPFRLDRSFKSVESGIFLAIHGSQMKDQRGKAEQVYGWRTGAGGDRPEGSLSGIPLGETVFVSDSEFGHRIQVVSDRYSLDVDAHILKEHREQGRKSHRVYARVLAERLARLILADAMALDLEDSGRPTYSAKLTGLEADKTGYVTLNKWAKDHRVKVSFDETGTIASFVFNRKLIKLPLASNKAIVDGVLVDLGGKFILARGKLWFVPELELANAAG